MHSLEALQTDVSNQSRNPEIQNVIFLENPKSPRKSGRFDIRKSPVALFVAEI